MTKAMRLLIVILSILVLLTSCARPMPIKVPDPTSAPTEETNAPTQPPTEVPTEAPTETTQPAKPAMTASELYQKVRGATGGTRANQYSQTTRANIRVGADGVFLRTESTTTKRVILSGMPCTVNVETESFAKSMDMEIEQLLHEYYRLENGKMVLYYYIDTLELYGKEILDVDPYDVLMGFSVAEFSYFEPDNLALAEEPEELEGKEVYALSYTIPLWYFTGTTGDTQRDTLLQDQHVLHTCYVDAETFLPLQIEASFSEVDESLADLLMLTYGNVYAEDLESVEIQINELTITAKDMVFEPVEVPAIPEEVLQGIDTSVNYIAA